MLNDSMKTASNIIFSRTAAYHGICTRRNSVGIYSFAQSILECDRSIVSRNEGHLTDSRLRCVNTLDQLMDF